MSLPKVSVIMNTLNENEKFLKEAIDSYITQSGVDLQFILSTVECDKSIEYVKNRYPSIEVVTVPLKKHPAGGNTNLPKGAYIQLNNALKYVKGDFVCYASSNDRAIKNKLVSEVNMLESYKKDVCYSNYNFIREDGKFIKTMKLPSYKHSLHLQGNIVTDCSMFRSSLIKEFLPFDLKLNNLGYWDFWLRVYKNKGDVFIHNLIPTWEYRQHPTSMRLKRLADPVKQEKELEERRKLIERYK